MGSNPLRTSTALISSETPPQSVGLLHKINDIRLYPHPQRHSSLVVTAIRHSLSDSMPREPARGECACSPNNNHAQGTEAEEADGAESEDAVVDDRHVAFELSPSRSDRRGMVIESGNALVGVQSRRVITDKKRSEGEVEGTATLSRS